MDVGPRKLCVGSAAKIRTKETEKGTARVRFALLAAPYLGPTGIRSRRAAPVRRAPPWYLSASGRAAHAPQRDRRMDGAHA